MKTPTSPDASASSTLRPPLRRVLSTLPLVAVALASPALAEVPHQLNYQGRVSVSGQNFTGTGQFKFALINTGATEAYWKNDGPPGNILVPPFGVNLPVQNGHYAVQLGDTSLTNMQALPASVFTGHSDVTLRVWFSDGAKGFQLMAPDQKLAAVGYAIMADSVSDGAITSAKLAQGVAQANLEADGLSGVARHGVILSDRENDPSLLAAGYKASGSMLARAENYWRQLASGPDRRRSHTAMPRSFPEGFIVWGGYVQPPGGSETLTGTGSRYDLLTDAWTPMSNANAPSPRTLHTAVESNGHMVVWGGTGATPFLGDGGRYSPFGDVWTPIPASPAITARRFHSAVAEAGEMFIFGGETAPGVYTGTGARYNIAAGTWTQLPIGPGSPGGRAAHSALMMGGKMVIWGGIGSGGVLNTGSIYDPATNSWSAMSTVGAPAARQGHQVVHVLGAAERMIVWGGLTAGGGLASGGIYTLATNSWAPVDTALAPSARTGNTLTFTGLDILCWGGEAAPGSYPTDGGAYDYGSNKWAATNTFPIPAGRTAHSAVWDGHETFVYGGKNASGDLKDLWLWQSERTIYLYARP